MKAVQNLVVLTVATALVAAFACAQDGPRTSSSDADAALTFGKPQKLAGDLAFAEGPVWLPDKKVLVFSEIQGNRMQTWVDGKLEVFREPSHQANGNTLDAEGRLVTCEHESRSVTRQDAKGKVETLAATFEGKKLNSPNDAVVRSDGMIWFTDPPYGLKKRKAELGKNYVFCLNPKTGKLTAVVDDFVRPNGVCLSPDEKKLYVADSGKPSHIRVFDVQPDGSLKNGRVFCDFAKGWPDGIRCDKVGRIWSSGPKGVHIFSPEGKLIARVVLPEPTTTNLCFGGADGKTLFMTTPKSLYSVTFEDKAQPASATPDEGKRTPATP
jgi:gluconolactonase